VNLHFDCLLIRRKGFGSSLWRRVGGLVSRRAGFDARMVRKRTWKWKFGRLGERKR